MSDKPKTIQEALAEIQRKVNEERAKKVAEMYSSLDEAMPEIKVGGKNLQTKAVTPKNKAQDYIANKEGTKIPPAENQNLPGSPPKLPKPASVTDLSKAAALTRAVSRIPKVGPVGTALAVGTTLAPEVAAKMHQSHKEAHSSFVPHKETPGVNVKDSFARMKEMGKKPTETPKPSELPKIDVPAKQTPSSFGAAFKAAREKATEMGKPSTGQFEYKGKQYQTNIKGEKYVAPSKQTKVDTSSTTATKPVATPTPKPETPKVETKPETTSTAPKAPEALGKTIGSALRGDLGRAGEGAKEWGSAVVTSLDRVRKNTADALDPKGANPEYESGNPKKGKNKMSEESNPLIAAFLKLQSENSQNMFEAAKKAKKDHDGDGKIESEKDEVWGSRFAAAKRAGKMEEEKILNLISDKDKLPPDPSHVKKVFDTPTEPIKNLLAKPSTEDGGLSKNKKKMQEANIDPVVTGSSSVTKSKTGYVDPSTPTEPYKKAPMSTAAGDVLDKAKNALDKTGVKEEDESLFSEAELEHFKSVFNEASVAPNRPEVAAEARPDSVKDGVSTNSGDTATESGKKKIKEESDAADETNMAKTQLKAMSSKAMNLHSKLKTSKNLPAWVQSKLAVAKDGVTAVDDYMTHSDKIKEETLEEGRPRKNPVASEEESPVKNIAAQVRTARSVTNDGGKSYHIPLKHPVSGKVHHVPQKAVDDFNKSYAAARKADEKEAVETAFKAKHMS
jgi:hypothetical protein